MKILVACEESQAVTIELRKLGHEAYSCDIEPCSGGHPEWHIQQDVLPILNGKCNFETSDRVLHNSIANQRWDMIIAFPPCTKTTNAGARHLHSGGELNIPRFYLGMCGKALFEAIRHANCERIAIENPTPSSVFEYPSPTQAVHPFEFGHEATKRTCLWLKGLSSLTPTDTVPRPKYREFIQKNGKARKTCWEMEQSGGKDRAKNRSKTFPGIAKAMAEQWAGDADKPHFTPPAYRQLSVRRGDWSIKMNGIIRVFPQRTAYTPEDNMAFVGMPPMKDFIPEHKEIHISCTFTWDKALCEELAFQWEGMTNKPVKLGGPAFGSQAEGFIQGMYIKPNIMFTTRGCNNNCPWCCVPKLEGKLKELPICPGNWIQDNNFLQANRAHKDKVFEMLRTQKGICFKGGLEVDLIDNHFIDNITSLRIKELWLACDTDARLPEFRRACAKLVKAGFSRDKIHCYVLSYGKDMDADEARARAVYEAGAMPFMQLYRDFSEVKTSYSKDWNAFARMWQRPAATRAHMEKGTSYKDFNT